MHKLFFLLLVSSVAHAESCIQATNESELRDRALACIAKDVSVADFSISERESFESETLSGQILTTVLLESSDGFKRLSVTAECDAKSGKETIIGIHLYGPLGGSTWFHGIDGKENQGICD